MRISHEAIYQALFIQGRGALRRELTACLRTGRALLTPRARVGQRGKGFVSPEIMISQRPAEASDRAIPGHWEGDLILGLDSSAIGTLVERNDPLHDAVASAATGRSWRRTASEEWTGSRWSWCRGRSQCHHAHHRDPASGTASFPDVGPRR
jgi:hypothetical protein